MKHEDVPGYTDLRAELFSARFQLQVAKTEEDINAAKERVNEVRRKYTCEILLKSYKHKLMCMK